MKHREAVCLCLHSKMAAEVELAPITEHGLRSQALHIGGAVQ